MGIHTGNSRQRCSMLLFSFCPERLIPVFPSDCTSKPPDLSPISTCFPNWPVKMATTLLCDRYTPVLFSGVICWVWQNLRSLTLLWSQLVSDSFFHAYLFCFLLSLSQLSVSLKLAKKSILLVSTFCLKELRLGARRRVVQSLYFYKTTLEKI